MKYINIVGGGGGESLEKGGFFASPSIPYSYGQSKQPPTPLFSNRLQKTCQVYDPIKPNPRPSPTPLNPGKRGWQLGFNFSPWILKNLKRALLPSLFIEIPLLGNYPGKLDFGHKPFKLFTTYESRHPR